MITPLAPAAGTSISAVIENDLFLMLTTLFSDRRPIPWKNSWVLPRMRVGLPAIAGSTRRAGGGWSARPPGWGPLGAAVVDRQHVVLGGFDQPQALQLGEHLGVVGGKIVG